ncbi:methylation-associated defense system ATP-binding protein MAD8 [Flavobacterium caseinilyticum]|uniref:ATP-binding protein n=1 Tax=Flavobacterium caseinilyticum TaxID=2541732 RepID=A0A4R5ASF5_9FLAO|nr:ATP-binding protein [Flavobacterium caseinilyticum]TDD74860.1 ATP-binding protein [Flavobacterium caseinilyticum]
MKNNYREIYYIRIVSLITKLHNTEFESAKPGHCMKITGLGEDQLKVLWKELKFSFPNIDIFIINEFEEQECFISATKLIELRNNQSKPLLILIPANNRTAAEDSYGNATFKEIALDNIENELLRELVSDIPSELKIVIKAIEDIVKASKNNKFNYILFLIGIKENSYDKISFGRLLNFIEILPDELLLEDYNLIRSRLTLNLKSCQILSTFNKTLYERVESLEIEKDSIQKDIVEMFKKETELKSISDLVNIISSRYSNLWFNHWKIPNLNFEEIKLKVLEVRSTDFAEEEGSKVLKAKENSNSNITIRFRTTPPPNQVNDLKFFRVILMAVDGFAGVEINTLRKLGNSNAKQEYREATVQLNPNNLEEGSYFFKIIAEGENGSILNTNDDFLSDKVQDEWEKSGKSKEAKQNLNYKLTSDTEDFIYEINENPDKEENQRKDKLNNVLQGHFKFNIELLKDSVESDFPMPSETSNIWLNDEKQKTNSIFHINYSQKHNYQIIVSSKLRQIEEEFLRNSKSIGYVNAKISNNQTSLGFEKIEFLQSNLNEIAPKKLLIARETVFKKISESNNNSNGIFETANIAEFKQEIKEYLDRYNNWINDLNKKISKTDFEESDKEKLKLVYSEIQFLDLVKVKTKLPNNESVSAVLISPLHPLRLAWFYNLIEVFESWHSKTVKYNDHAKDWSRLQDIFLGKIHPNNNPYVFVDPSNFTNYEYAGEMTFGWGIYFNIENLKGKDNLVPVTHQLKNYYKSILNISKDNYTDNEVSRALLVKHLKNFLFQHPYTDKLVVNLFNVGDADKFADAFVDLSRINEYSDTKFEVRIFIGNVSLIEPGNALKELINPETNISEEAELFSQASDNRLFPKLRFSINNIEDFLINPEEFNAHLSFLVNPFTSKITLTKPNLDFKSNFLNGLFTINTTEAFFDKKTDIMRWINYIDVTKTKSNLSASIFTNFQKNIACALASHNTDAIPAIQLDLNDRDKVLISHLHEYSDWVITFDKNLGPQIFDQPSVDNEIPFLLDYIPSENISGISSYLTTKPSSEIIGLLSPHFEEFGLDIANEKDVLCIKTLLEDLRAISSTLVLQLNSSKNKAFEVIGSAFSKRILQKKGLLENAFIVPIDLHQELFENLSSNSKSRADNLVFTVNTQSREINISVLEIKCRTYLSSSEREELKNKMIEQIENTILALKTHFDPNNYKSEDRLDREIKNLEFKRILEFYIERAFRYQYLSYNAYNSYINFIQTLNEGYILKFNKVGFIFDFSFDKKHLKQVLDENTNIFTFGHSLIKEILDTDSDLNTQRLEDLELSKDLAISINANDKLKPFLKKYEPKLKPSNDEVTKTSNNELEVNVPTSKNQIVNNDDTIEEFEKTETLGLENETDVKINEINKLDNSTSPEEIFIGNTNIETFLPPAYDLLIGKSSSSEQFGLLGTSIHNKKIAIDLSETNTISLFGVQGGGKSYTIGTISEMVLKQVQNVNILNSPLASVIFHYSESMDYEPEFTSMIFENDEKRELAILKEIYGANPSSIKDVILLTPIDKVEERRIEFPSIEVLPISFNSRELNVQDWMFLLGAIGNDSAYIRQLKAIMRAQRNNLSLLGLRESVEESELLTSSQKALARQKLNFAQEYINDEFYIKDLIRPGRLIIVDLRDEFIVKDEALGLFVIMLNIFSGVKVYNEKPFNKFIVFDEAHKYMDNKDLTNNIVTAIREMRHKGVSIMIASQDPPSLPNEIIELSSIVLVHKFNSPQWLKHIQKSINQLSNLSANDLSMLKPGEGFLWASKATEIGITNNPVKILTRPRFTKHGGATLKADRK